MSIKSNDSLISKLHLFTRHLPDSSVLFSAIFLLSIGTGMISVALSNYHEIGMLVFSILTDGILSGILIILLPTLLTVATIKFTKRFVRVKYLLFIALIGAIVYSLFLILASAIYQIVGSYSLSTAIVIVGDASIYGWWFFINKVLLGQKKQAVVFSGIQPVLNVLVYLFASSFIFTFSDPLTVLLVKLGAGILVFLAISYMILYIFDSPVKRNLGFDGINAFSQVVQSWLFDIDTVVAMPLGGENFGVRTDVDVSTIVYKRSSNKSIKAIMFAPFIHYGPVGVLGGSDFPYQLERYSQLKYKAPIFVMHCTVNESCNPISNSQINQVKGALDSGVKGAKKISEKPVISFTTSKHDAASVSLLSVNNVGIATLTRAPYVTEDISPEAARLFRELFEARGNNVVLIDAHNSRYESATNEELQGVKPNSKYLDEYVHAIKKLGKPEHTTQKMKVGVSSIEIYNELGSPTDLAPGKLNVIIFYFNGFKYSMIQFNANNAMPSLRKEIIEHVKKSYGISAEVYTTDTHFVNSLERNASNVLGRATRVGKLLPLVDKAIGEAMANAEYVDIYYKKDVIKKFRMWGPDMREKAVAVITSVVGLAKVLVPTIVVAGFIVASWIISLV